MLESIISQVFLLIWFLSDGQPSATNLQTSSLNIVFLKPGQIVWWKRYYVGQGEFQIEHHTIFLKEIRMSRVCMAL